MKKARLFLIGAFIVLLVILYSRTEGFANLDKSTKCKLALINLTTAAEMPYFAQNDPTIFAKRVDKFLNDFKNLNCPPPPGTPIYRDYIYRILQALNNNYVWCSHNPNKCDKGRKLLIQSLQNSSKYLGPGSNFF